MLAVHLYFDLKSISELSKQNESSASFYLINTTNSLNFYLFKLKKKIFSHDSSNKTIKLNKHKNCNITNLKRNTEQTKLFTNLRLTITLCN